jgi:hypothetical protein
MAARSTSFHGALDEAAGSHIGGVARHGLLCSPLAVGARFRGSHVHAGRSGSSAVGIRAAAHGGAAARGFH